MGQKGLTGIPRLIAAFGNSIAGIKVCWRQEEAFRQEIYVLMLAVPLGLWMGDSGVERSMLIGSILLIAIIETLNSAVEAVVDRIGDEYHELSGYAKDIASAGVLLSNFLALMVWGLIAYDKLLG